RLEYLGRADYQVKIRGFRIELGEIEAALLGQAGVAEAVVVAREVTGSAHQQLVAYLVAAAGAVVPDVAALRAQLSTVLPGYMVPAVFVTLDALPLTANGKVDRTALPAPDQLAAPVAEYVAPRTETERVVAEIWARVLGVAQVGIYDNFFELGGDSILSIQVMSRVRVALKVELSPRVLFVDPTVAGLAAAVAESAVSALPAIPVADRVGELPLSFAQQRLWFLDQFSPGETGYVIAFAAHLRGELDLDALSRALTELITRHESLRTTFDTIDGRGVQVVHPPQPMLVPVRDLSDLSAPEQDTHLRQLLTAETNRPFDLARGPLLRVALIRLNTGEHVLTVAMHHIITDAWSMGIFAAELGALYSATICGQQPHLPPLDIHYVDYALWQRQLLSEAVLDTAMQYWRAQLAGVPALELPTDRPRPAVMTSAGATHQFVVPASVAAGLARLGQRLDGTLFMTLVAACQILFSRYSGQHDIAVGTVTSGRDRAELEGLIGFFVNTLVLRSQIDSGHSFNQFLAQVRETVLDAFAHQQVPFERVVDELIPVRDTSRTPLFQAMVVLQNAPGHAPELAGLDVSGVELPLTTAQFDLTIQFNETGDTLAGAFIYNTDLFDGVTMERMAQHLLVLLGGIVAGPDRPVRELPLLTQAEAAQFVDWNETGREVPGVVLSGLFEVQVGRGPDVEAVRCGSVVLSYGELNERANRLARLLIGWGVGPEQFVGVALPRSVEMVVALLAVAKAGAGYVPIDPGYPAARVEFMCADAGPVVVLCVGETVGCVPGDVARLVIDDPLVVDQLAAQSSGDVVDADRVAPLCGAHCAYVIYTSGSTGRPKGVVVSHAALVNFLGSMGELFPLGPGDRWLAVTTIAFDIAALELYLPLVSGA
ncbi:MAG: AMP-binding protein, partial [Solirubrobacterales bacterium]|nr:AMP-binding protein [Solirubrobacterales bacterium]